MRSSLCFLVAGLLLESVAFTHQQVVLEDELGSHSKHITQTQRRLLDLHANLTNIPSITDNEHAVSVYLESYLQHELNFTTERFYVSDYTSRAEQSYGSFENEGKRRFSIFAYRGRDPKGARTLLSSHIDTVPPFYPYKYNSTKNLQDDGFSGRGSVDAKASVATQITALRSLIEDRAVEPSSVALLFVVGEETIGDGMRTASRALTTKGYTHWKSVIFGEPTEGKLACGHKGISLIKVEANGKSAHSGYPWLGVNANTLLIRALASMEDVAARKGVAEGGLPYTDKYGWTTMNIGRIEGGVASNVIPAYAKADVTLRLADGTPKESIDILWKAAQDATADLRDKGGSLRIQRSSQGYPPVDIDCDVDGFETITVNYGTDVPNFQVKGSYQRHLYGPGSILVAHSDHETGSVKDLLEAVAGYRRLILHTLDA